MSIYQASGHQTLYPRLFTSSLSAWIVLFVLGVALPSAFAAVEVASPPPLRVLRFSTTPNGFNSAPRGWNSFGMQVGISSATRFVLNQSYVIAHCDLLADPSALGGAGYEYCSLDSGWSIGDHGDDHGRIVYDRKHFDMPRLADHLHDLGLKLGVYVVPGAFMRDANKTIFGTNITLHNVSNGNFNGLARFDFDYSKDGVQQWHNSVVDLFTEWGVDMIKLDFVTPGSPQNGVHLSPNTSGSVIAYHNAILQASRPMRLDISWKLERNETFYDIWRTNADSMRTDQDINNMRSPAFVSWATVQRAIDNYRQYINIQVPLRRPLTVYPDLDNLFVGNPANVSGISDAERQTVMTHWIGAGANLIVGSDLLQLDDLGRTLLTDPEALAIANFTSTYPMQPRNPGTGAGVARQLQSWIAGPADDTGVAIVVLANYGRPRGRSGFEGQPQIPEGPVLVTVSLSDLGIAEGSYRVRDVWAHEEIGVTATELGAVLDAGESKLLKLTSLRPPTLIQQTGPS